jgi:hypothetical protein
VPYHGGPDHADATNVQHDSIHAWLPTPARFGLPQDKQERRRIDRALHGKFHSDFTEVDELLRVAKSVPAERREVTRSIIGLEEPNFPLTARFPAAFYG